MVGGINRNSYLYYCQRKTNYIYSVNRHFLLPKRPAWPTSLLPWIIYLTLAFSLEQDLLSALSKSIFGNLFRVAITDSPKRLWWYHWICWTLSAVGIFCILLAHDHYTVDVVVAYFITTRLFWWYHTLANQQVSSASISNLRDLTRKRPDTELILVATVRWVLCLIGVSCKGSFSHWMRHCGNYPKLLWQCGSVTPWPHLCDIMLWP